VRTAAAILLVLLAASPAAAADPDQIVAEARRAFDSGRFKEAAAKYLEAAGAPGLAADRVADLSVQAAWASYIDGDAPAARSSLRKAYLARPELEVLPEFYSEDFARLAAAVKSQTAPPAKIDVGELKRSARERLAAGMAQDVLYDLRRIPESGDTEIHRLTAQALEKLGKADEADAERRRAAELEAGVVTQAPIGALPSPPPPQPAPIGPVVEVGPMLEAAEAALAKNDTRGAAELARRAADSNPRSSSAHRLLGDVALADGDAATAEREYIAATAIDPNDSKAEVGLGKLADRARQPNTAAAHYRRALELDSHSLAAALGLGEALDQAGDKPSARLAFGRATEIDPKSAAARDRYGVFLQASGDVGAAIDQGVEAVRLEIGTASYRAHLGLSYLGARMHKEADRELSEAVRLDPKNPVFENALGTSKLRQGDFTAASEAFTRARALAPGDETASTGLAAALTAAGKPAEAEAVLKQAGADLPRSFAIANDLGVVEVRLGNYDAAVAAFTRALEISPESADAAAALARAASLRGFQAAAVAPPAQ
jgi:tetratricopeptide (TPR) repeat protein